MLWPAQVAHDVDHRDPALKSLSVAAFIRQSLQALNRFLGPSVAMNCPVCRRVPVYGLVVFGKRFVHSTHDTLICAARLGRVARCFALASDGMIVLPLRQRISCRSKPHSGKCVLAQQSKKFRGRTMADKDCRAYFVRRETEERERARVCKCNTARDTHLSLADEYGRRARGEFVQPSHQGRCE
jgi:hypothetical protein